MEPDPSETSSFDDAFPDHSVDAWETLARKTLNADQAIDDLATHTLDGLSIQALYTERANESASANHQIAAVPSANNIDNRIQINALNAKEANASLLAGLSGGATSFELNLNDDISAELPTVLDGVHLDIAPISLSPNHCSPNAIEQLERVWQQQKVEPAKRLAAFNSDPLDQVYSGRLSSDDVAPALQQVVDYAKRYSDVSPKVSVASVNLARHHACGASAAQELVAAIATATPYVEAMLSAGLSLSHANNHLVFRVACDSDFLMNVVKLRALKKLWGSVCVGLEPELQKFSCNISAETSNRMQATTSPWVNHLRNTAACAAAMVGGASSITVTPHNYIDNQWIDAEVELGTRMARNLPIILEQESLLTSVNDPMGGAYAVESLTDEMVNIVWQSLLDIEKSGGWIKTITSGSWGKALAETQENRLQNLRDEQKIRVGVNRFQIGEAVSQTDITDKQIQKTAFLPKPARDAEAFGA